MGNIKIDEKKKSKRGRKKGGQMWKIVFFLFFVFWAFYSTINH